MTLVEAGTTTCGRFDFRSPTPQEVTTMRRGIGRWRDGGQRGFVLAVLALAGFGIVSGGGPALARAADVPGPGRVRDDRRPGGRPSRPAPGDRRRSRRAGRAAERAGPAGRAGPADRRAAPAAGPHRRGGPDRLRRIGRRQGRGADARRARRAAGRRARPDRLRAADRGGRPAQARPPARSAARGPDPVRRARARRDQRHRRLDPPGRRQPRQARQR